MEKLTQVLPVPQSMSRVNMITCSSPKQCSKCKEDKLNFYGESCFACYWIERGDKLPWVNCPECNKEVSKLKTSVCWDCEDIKEQEKHRESRLRKTLLEFFKSDKKIKELTLENFERFDGTEEALTACARFDPENDNLYIWGATGRGKTHLAYATAQKWVRLGKSIDIYTMRDFFNRFRMCKPEDEKRISDELINKDVLVLDDLGRAAPTDFSMDILANIIDKRALMNKNGLIVTSNLFLEHLAKQGNDRLSSRISGLCRVVEIESKYDVRLERRR